MKTPAFWSARHAGLPAYCLAPLGWIYGIITARRMQRSGLRLPVPVISVGNFTAGGDGKTPTAIAIARILLDQKVRPVFISRGYGGRLKGPVLVDPERHSAADVGDEPLLLARVAPTIIGRDRALRANMVLQHQIE